MNRIFCYKINEKPKKNGNSCGRIPFNGLLLLIKFGKKHLIATFIVIRRLQTQ